MLSVTASNATQVVISDNVDSSTMALAATGGTQKVSPATTTTYTATATGPGGTATATAMVTVAASVVPPTVTIAANPTTIVQGSSSTLSVTATNATQVVISDNVDSNKYTLAGTGGTQVVAPSTTTTYTATATGAGGTATAQAVITVSPSPVAPTVTMAANPTTIVQGSSSTLTVTASECDAGRDLRQCRQHQVHAGWDRRDAERHAEHDDNLYGDGDWRRRLGDGHSCRHGYGRGSHGHHCGESDAQSRRGVRRR